MLNITQQTADCEVGYVIEPNILLENTTIRGDFRLSAILHKLRSTVRAEKYRHTEAAIQD